jgi:hypothetical protein
MFTEEISPQKRKTHLKLKMRLVCFFIGGMFDGSET